MGHCEDHNNAFFKSPKTAPQKICQFFLFFFSCRFFLSYLPTIKMFECTLPLVSIILESILFSLIGFVIKTTLMYIQILDGSHFRRSLENYPNLRKLTNLFTPSVVWGPNVKMLHSNKKLRIYNQFLLSLCHCALFQYL